MIIKGTSRGNPKQLAAHLLRTDTNEKIQILELNSPTTDLASTFRDWQLLTAATAGHHGLYHANISPDAGYTMTPEEWERAADVLAEKLGLSHQPRAIVLHEKDGREHIHVVWQRTDTDTMTLVSDSWNYLAHEEASLALEQEFGHEHVPGKHAKRDREQQPEFPRAETNHAEWQQAERAGIDPHDFKTTITMLYHQCDTGQALKTALEHNNLILATGDKRGFVIVDEQGEVFSLSRQLLDVKAKDMKELLKDIGPLPTVEQARAQQETREEGREFVRQKMVELQHEPPQADARQPQPDKPARYKDTAPQDEAIKEFLRQKQSAAQPEPPKQQSAQQQPEPPKPASGLSDQQCARLEAALEARHRQETRRLIQQQEDEKTRVRQDLDRLKEEKVFELKALHKEALDQYDRDHARSPFAVKRAAFRAWFNPAEEEKRTRERAAFYTSKRQELNQQIKALRTPGYKGEAALADRHAKERADHQLRFEQERARLLAEEAAAAKLLAEFEKQHRQEKLNLKRPGPEPPKRSL